MRGGGERHTERGREGGREQQACRNVHVHVHLHTYILQCIDFAGYSILDTNYPLIRPLSISSAKYSI